MGYLRIGVRPDLSQRSHFETRQETLADLDLVRQRAEIDGSDADASIPKTANKGRPIQLVNLRLRLARDRAVWADYDLRGPRHVVEGLTVNPSKTGGPTTTVQQDQPTVIGENRVQTGIN